MTLRIVCGLLILLAWGKDAQAQALSTITENISARLSSCDAGEVRAASQELLGNPKALTEATLLFLASHAHRRIGDRQEAAFFFFAAQLRAGREAIVRGGDYRQVHGLYSGLHGSVVRPALESNPDLAAAAASRALAWDRNTPDRNRDRPEASTAQNRQRLVEAEAAVAGFSQRLREDPDRIERARKEDVVAERELAARSARDCAPGRLDPKDLPALNARIKREAAKFVESHAMVKARAPGKALRASVASTQSKAGGGLPQRLTIDVRPHEPGVRSQPNEAFFAEVQVQVGVGPDRTVQAIDYSLLCLTNLWIGQRDSKWKDVCVDDPAAQRP